MPLPITRDKSKLMRKIKEHHPGWSRKQKVAVMLSQARKAGAKIPKKKLYRRKKRYGRP